MQPQLMTSDKDMWETSVWLFKKLDNVFKFKLDVAADDKNHLCSMYFTEENSALDHIWSDCSRPDPCIGENPTAFCNPPYSNGGLIHWFRKFKQEYDNGWTIVVLHAARTETKWFRIAWDHAKYVIFLYGRLKFTLNKQEIGTATFPSAISVFTKQEYDLSSLAEHGKIIQLR